MSDQSLFSKHLRIITEDPSQLNEAERKEWNKINKLELPPLRLSKKRESHWAKIKEQWYFGLSALTIASLALVLVLPRQSDDTFTAKGSTQISVYWQRNETVSPFTESSELVDGDKVGVKIIADQDSVAYWTVADKDFKVLDDVKDIESGKLNVKAGVSASFDSSFQLTAPNQGEHLIVIVCPNPNMENTGRQLVLDREFITDVVHGKNKKAQDCIYAGFRLRKAP
tara:strand:+ start:23592 stop:24269 length:678 start_codon:yes stop_codon:yes gene_type:complete